MGTPVQTTRSQYVRCPVPALPMDTLWLKLGSVSRHELCQPPPAARRVAPELWGSPCALLGLPGAMLSPWLCPVPMQGTEGVGARPKGQTPGAVSTRLWRAEAVQQLGSGTWGHPPSTSVRLGGHTGWREAGER